MGGSVPGLRSQVARGRVGKAQAPLRHVPSEGDGGTGRGQARNLVGRAEEEAEGRA